MDAEAQGRTDGGQENGAPVFAQRIRVGTNPDSPYILLSLSDGEVFGDVMIGLSVDAAREVVKALQMGITELTKGVH